MKTLLTAGATVLLLGSVAADAASYVRSTVGPPWNEATNEAAMDDVFGTWDDLRFETVNINDLLMDNFIFLEGGDHNAEALETFLGANSMAIEDYVAAGGRIFINAAPNFDDGMSFGFGVSLVYTGSDFCVNDCDAVNGAHPIFNGPFTPVGTSFGGGAFSHGYVTGTATALITDTGTGLVLLGETIHGSGLALFGALTTDNYQNPKPNSANLRRNILAYASGADVMPDVPLPAGFGLLAVAVGGLAALRRRA